MTRAPALHVCTYAAPRALCGGTLSTAHPIEIAGRRARVDAAELVDPRQPADAREGCLLADVELEIGWLALISPSSSSGLVRPCLSCLEHVARLRATATPPVRHALVVPGVAACGRALRAGLAFTPDPGAAEHLITGYVPGVVVALIPCATCIARSSQRAMREQQRAVRQAQLLERRQARAQNRILQRGNIAASDRAFAFLDDDNDDLPDRWN
jgi:hypothetical protein